MTQSRILQRHIEQLKEIRNILHSLKNMAFMELHKLARLQQAQNRVVAHIEDVATDFLQSYPGMPELGDGSSAVIVVGSERGFCGNFNETLIDKIPTLPSPDTVIAIGNRLCNRLQDYPVQITAISGANGSEEIGQVMSNLTNAIGNLQQKKPLFRLDVLFHRDEHSSITRQTLLPPFTKDTQSNRKTKPEPMLNLDPAAFLFELVDHYLLSSLQAILYMSLATENNQRLQHLDNAVRHLDQQTAKLYKITRIHRQEEITEEIEVILLNTENPPTQNV